MRGGQVGGSGKLPAGGGTRPVLQAGVRRREGARGRAWRRGVGDISQGCGVTPASSREGCPFSRTQQEAVALTLALQGPRRSRPYPGRPPP